MRYLSSLIVPVVAVGFSIPALAQGPVYGVGRPPSAAEIRALDISIGPEGKELPPGSGTPQQGATVFVQRRCVNCHGPTGKEGPAPQLVVEKDYKYAGSTYYPPSLWPFAPSVWDFINRAMPYDRPGYLSVDEVYAVTAYLLYRNGIIQEGDVMDAKSLPKVQMPNRNGYDPPPPDWKPGLPRPFVFKP